MSSEETKLRRDLSNLSLKHKLTYWYLDHIMAFAIGLAVGGAAIWWMISFFTEPGIKLYIIIAVFGISFGLLVRYTTTIIHHWLEK